MNKDMEADIIYYELKLQSLLEKFLENGYHIKNEVYFNRLLSFLGGKENKELAEVLLKLPLMVEWILRAIKLWEDQSHIPEHSVSAFALQLLGLISKNQITFNELSKHNIYNRTIHILQVRKPDSLPTIKLGYIKLLSSVLAHSSGREWLEQTNYWQDILTLSLQSQTVYITREGHCFIASFLDAMLQHNITFCSSIWQTIITPLLIKPDDRFKNQNQNFEACDDRIEKFLGPSIRLIVDILEYFFEKCLEADNSHMKNFKSISLMPEMVEAISNYLYIVRDPDLVYEIGRAWILLLYISMMVEVKNGVIKPNIDKEFMEPVFALFTILTDNFKTAPLSKFFYIILLYWYKLKAKIKVEYIIESNKKYTFEDQFGVFQLIPTFAFCKAISNNELEENDFREDYVVKIFDKLSKTAIRWGYKWRDACLPIDTILYIGPKSISYLLQLKIFISRDSAVTIFQALLYSFADMVNLVSKNENYLPMFTRCESFLKILLDAMTEVIDTFHISFKDSFESLCVFRVSVEFLKIPTWSSKLVIADLNLIKVGIKRYLSPNFALLIDRQDNCSIYILSSLLRTKLHDPDWSVRDSSLEVVSVMAEASCIEFPSFQRIIVNNDLCNLVVTTSIQDGESFVRASALKCLNQMVQIDSFWKNHLENQQITKKIIQILKCETEGIVRAQAATVLTTVFKYHDIETLLQQEIYAAMGSAALDDLHWEVRLNSLAFWNARVEEKLRDQGMVDGTFPKCTFATECRKIVNLTDTEIKKRILRALDQLSEIGCLTVLKHSITDDSDIQVSKKSLEISKRLVDLIEKYKLAENINLGENGPPSNDSCYSSTVPSTPSPSTFQNCDDIIDQILGVSDTSLLKDVYNPGKDYTSNVGPVGTSCRHVVTRAEFLVLTRKNFKSLVDDREKWINSLDSLSSLLNDMLQSYEPTDTNAMDCY